ncbi:hypothetical protein CERSUDRAFT_88986 [Gelatoporia subvermispora B]|uniref:Nephrocystin 3-like N-terminal domain-containing protein n=1 Tax=Ceriporiopsis subvermispora (strain B) TaxID=914234 RepID=M2P808_CERS8|nr:hypothetical protein CERSUDRAFT_88986 [Gelatoporia subvermispora B]
MIDDFQLECNLYTERTVAISLAYQLPVFKWALLKQHPDAGHDRVEVQVERLLRGPLLEAFGDVLRTLVLVVDALDECADENATSTILIHLLQVASHMPIKFFVTSRPDQHIRSRFHMGDAGTIRILRLHEMEDSIIEADIYVYTSHRLRETPTIHDRIRPLIFMPSRMTYSDGRFQARTPGGETLHLRVHCDGIYSKDGSCGTSAEVHRPQNHHRQADERATRQYVYFHP